MKSSDDLFRLVKSLSRSEKRYFKLFASMYRGEKKYLVLFDAIDAQENFDEEALKAQFRDERFVAQLSVAKRYLYEQILRSLRVLHERASVRSQIRTLIHNMEVLYQKGLRDQARKMFDSALELAVEHEEFVSLLEATEWIERFQPELSSTEEGIEFVGGRFADAFERFRNYIDVGVAARKIALPVMSDQPRTFAELEYLDQAVESLPEKDLSVRASLMRCLGLATYHFARSEYREALRYTDREIDLLEANPALIDASPVRYISAVSNKLVLLKRTQNFEEFRSTLEAARIRAQELLINRQLWSARLRAELFASFRLNYINYCLALDLRDQFARLARETERELEEHATYLRPHVVMKFNTDLALMYFALGDYRRALDASNRTVEASKPDRGWETYYHARLMNLVIHYELGNHDLLEYLVPSTYRFFRTRDLIYKFESIVLDFFRQLVRVKAGRRSLVELFAETRERLAPLEHDPLEANPFRHFQYLSWLDEKIDALGGAGISAIRTTELRDAERRPRRAVTAR